MAGRLVVGNWKLHGTLAEAQTWAQAACGPARALAAAGVHLAVAPPATAAAALRVGLGDCGVALAAQDIYPEDRGAFTGALSARLWADAGASLALVGHSERRALFGDTDAACGARLAACARHGLTPILCVGESLAAWEAGESKSVVLRQLAAATEGYFASGPKPLIVAYEPIWAIGTGKVASPAAAQAVHVALREALAAQLGQVAAAAVPLVYGGSVKPDNAAALFAQSDIDGALVGGASLDAAAFMAIAQAGLSLAA